LNDVEATFREVGDRRSVFLTVYTEMTRAVEDGLETGFFEDPDWVRRLLVTFANHYRRALVGYERGERSRVPPPWDVGFDAMNSGSTVILQDALLGVNAHIDFDLTYTVDQVGMDPNRQSKFEDYARINDILARLVDSVQEALVSVYDSQTVDALDVLFGPIDEPLAVYGLEEAREFAWNNATLLNDSGWPFVRSYVKWRVTSVSTGAAYLILSPTLDRVPPDEIVVAERQIEPTEAFRTAFTEAAPGGEPGDWSIPW
jgi:hypothetical protein